jgi:hypothetical protein
MHWRQLRRQFLPHYGTDPEFETKLIAWESTDLYFQEPDITVVANTRWLGSMAGRWLGGPMAAVGPVVEKADKSPRPLISAIGIALERVIIRFSGKLSQRTDALSIGSDKVSCTA